MSLLDQIREEKLIELAKTRFDSKLTPAELKVLHDSASSEDLSDPDEKAPRPEVRAEFLRWLAIDPEAAPHIDPKGLRMLAATILGKLDLRECHIKQTLVFRHCDFQGEFNLESAETPSLFLYDSSLAEGIRGDGFIVHGSLILWRIISEREITLVDAHIEGIINLIGAKLKAKDRAFSADRLKVGGSIFMNCGFESEGSIRLVNADISGDLNCSGAKLMARYDALCAPSARIGSVFLDQGFESIGEINLAGALIEGDLSVIHAKVGAVTCSNMVVTGNLIWQRIEICENTFLSLLGVKVKNLRDDEKSWPNKTNLVLDGLVYEDLTLHESLSNKKLQARNLTNPIPLIVEKRIEWIMRQYEVFQKEPQPWMQLRKLLERKGDRKGAKYVLRRFRWLQAQKSWVLWCWWKKAFAWLEENPFRIGLSIALTLLIGTSVFTWGGSSGAMIETVRFQPNAIKDNGEVKPVSPHYPKYQPFVYTLENAVPLIKLGMDDKWTPDPGPEFCRVWFPRWPWLYFISTYGILVFTRWALIVGGWIQATILAAAVADRFKK